MGEGELVERLTGDFFDDPAQDLEVDVGVAEGLAGLDSRGRGSRGVSQAFWRAVFVVGDRVVGDQARAVSQKLVERDRAFAVVVELGKELGQGVVEVELA